MSLTFEWGTGKTFRIVQIFTRADGVPVAELFSVGGLLDLTARKLVAAPGERFRAMATVPEILGL